MVGTPAWFQALCPRNILLHIRRCGNSFRKELILPDRVSSLALQQLWIRTLKTCFQYGLSLAFVPALACEDLCLQKAMDVLETHRGEHLLAAIWFPGETIVFGRLAGQALR